MRFPWQSKSPRLRHKPLLRVPFYGQESLLAALDEQRQAAKNGTVQFVTLAGEAGSGKSALLTEFAIVHCAKPEVLLVTINAADCWLADDIYSQLFASLQERSERILQTIYNDTKRIRKTQGLQWDEKEFFQMITSADWSQPQESPATGRSATGRQAPLAALLSSIRQHPWAVAAATLLATMTRGMAASAQHRPWAQRWTALLQALQPQLLAGEAVLVLIIDQLEATASLPTATQQTWQQIWQTFAAACAGRQLPLLLIWAGTAESLQPVQQALQGSVPLHTYHMQALPEADYLDLIRRTVRALPRPLRLSWERIVTAAWQTHSRTPDCLLLAAACVAAAGDADEATLSNLAQADRALLVDRLLQATTPAQSTDTALGRELLEVWAFLPPGKRILVEDLLPLCDRESLRLDPIATRTGLEKLLGQWIRYGLLTYDPYTMHYTTGHSGIQTVLQQLAYPDAQARQTMRVQRRLAAAVLYHIQYGERAALGALAHLLDTTRYEVSEDLWGPVLLAPFRRLLPARTRAERQRIATALGGFTSPMAIDLLQLMLHDEEGQVRSGVVQSLADLALEEALPTLLEALRDPNSDVRWIAARALGEMTGTAAVDALIPMLSDDDKEVARIAAEGLGRQGDGRAVPHLIAAMRESYPLLRESAALALGQLADKRALPALQETLHDTNRQVRRSAESALARFTASP